MENYNKVQCQICKELHNTITWTHLKRAHGITLKEYIKLYPDVPMASQLSREGKKTNSLSHFIKVHGEELGKEKYDAYRKFQSEKNTLKYKQEKYGWTEEEFTEYNKSRAVTLENQIKKHGKEKGRKQFEEYCEIQRSAGISLEYFQQKYGIKRGKQIYKEVNKKKAHTIENYIRLYGEKHAEKKLVDFFKAKNERGTIGISKLQKDFLELLHAKLPLKVTEYAFSAIDDEKEFVQWVPELNAPAFYDFVMLEPIKLVIEINGNYWHCNPTMYNENYFHGVMKRKASEIWEKDRLKEQHMIKLGFKYLTVWESDCKDLNKKVEEVAAWILSRLK